MKIDTEKNVKKDVTLLEACLKGFNSEDIHLLSESLKSISLQDLVKLKLEVLFSQQREAHVQIDGLYDLVLEQVEKPLIELSLRQFKGNQFRTAKMLGMNRNTLKRKIDFYKIKIRTIKKMEIKVSRLN